jgi:hypothetical protein
VRSTLHAPLIGQFQGSFADQRGTNCGRPRGKTNASSSVDSSSRTNYGRRTESPSMEDRPTGFANFATSTRTAIHMMA